MTSHPVQESGVADGADAGSSVDSSDARGNVVNTNSYGIGDHPGPSTSVENTTVYRMDRAQRGKFIIINNKTFQSQTQMSARSGTDVDAANLYKLFKDIGFETTLHNDQTIAQMHKLMTGAGGEDHTNRNCFGVAILSHGDEGLLYGVDGQISIENLIAPIKNCATLAGKPKIFFFQACRGQGLDDGTVAHSDAETDEEYAKRQAKQIRIPLEADFLYAYSTTPGYFSWRNSTKGSWFVQALYQVLSEKSLRKDLDLGRLLTRVCYIVAYQFESNASQAHMNQKKQVPSIVSMLTKELYLK